MKNRLYFTTALLAAALAVSACGGKTTSNSKDYTNKVATPPPLPPIILPPEVAEFVKEQQAKGPAQNAPDNRPGHVRRDAAGNVLANNPGINSNTDRDSITNPVDNCPYVDNEDQNDRDGDDVGDACDNCPDTANESQENVCNPDAAGFTGDAITAQRWRAKHTDSDSDGLPDYWDKCPRTRNELKSGRTQGSKDPNDYTGLDSDTDGDGFFDGCDNCPNVFNPNQADIDHNGKGDVCQTPPPEQKCKLGGEGDTYCQTNLLGDSCSSKQQCICGAADVPLIRENPNLIFILDISGSMEYIDGNGGGTSGMQQMKSALNTFADEAYNSFNYGFIAFPGNVWLGNKKLAVYNDADSLKSVYVSLKGNGKTPTDEALNEVVRAFKANEFQLPGESSTRRTVALLLTDGSPDPGREAPTATAASELYKAGVELYVVGMGNKIKEKSLVECATNGSGGKRKDYFGTQDSRSLIKTISVIAKESASCDVLVQANQHGSNTIFVEANGHKLTRKRDFNYDPQTKRLQLNPGACTRLNSVTKPELKVSLGCDICIPDRDVQGNLLYPDKAATDEGALGLCDGRDNDCDGEIDEGCKCDGEEVCGDGLDNDCDGTVDNGCGTKNRWDECENDNDCLVPLYCEFDTARQKKVCKEPCRGLGSDCKAAGDCCSGSCGSGICSAG